MSPRHFLTLLATVAVQIVGDWWDRQLLDAVVSDVMRRKGLSREQAVAMVGRDDPVELGLVAEHADVVRAPAGRQRPAERLPPGIFRRRLTGKLYGQIQRRSDGRKRTYETREVETVSEAVELLEHLRSTHPPRAAGRPLHDPNAAADDRFI